VRDNSLCAKCKQHLLRAGQASPEGVKLISANSNQAVIEDLGKQSTLTLGRSISSNFSAPRNQRMKIVPDARGMYRTTGSINGFPVNFMVDTGATLVSMNRQQAKRLGIDYKIEGVPAVSSTASGYSRIYLVKLKRVKIGEIELRNIKAAVHDGDFPKITLLGMSFLGQLEMLSSGGELQLSRKY
jgi:aspartyl protease family protein